VTGDEKTEPRGVALKSQDEARLTSDWEEGWRPGNQWTIRRGQTVTHGALAGVLRMGHPSITPRRATQAS
jgi:hypothetical protein